MPNYIFHCGECGDTREYLLPMGAQPKACENCGDNYLERVWDGQTFSARSSSKLEGKTASCPSPSEHLPGCPLEGLPGNINAIGIEILKIKKDKGK